VQEVGENYIIRSFIICISFTNVVCTAKSRGMRIVGHVARMGAERRGEAWRAEK
jgi:hypothetical protein